jgi:hypothetical protein
MKKNRGDEPTGIIVYIYTRKYHKEMPCVATFISNKPKCYFLFLLFLFYKIREQEYRTCPAQRGSWYQ